MLWPISNPFICMRISNLLVCMRIANPSVSNLFGGLRDLNPFICHTPHTSSSSERAPPQRRALLVRKCVVLHTTLDRSDAET